MTVRTVINTIWGLFILYILSVSCLCFLNLSFPSELDIQSCIFGIRADRVAHFLMFFPFCILAVPISGIDRKETDRLKLRGILLPVVAGVCFSAFTELVQNYFLPAREGDIVDFLADLSGLTAGLLFYLLVVRPLWRKRSLQTHYSTDENISQR